MNVYRNALVISEIALALVLSVGVLTQSSLRRLHVPVGSILRRCGPCWYRFRRASMRRDTGCPVSCSR